MYASCYPLPIESIHVVAFKDDVMRLAMKTTSYGITHVMVATTVAYILTGNLAAAIGIGLIEPIIQTGVFAIHEYLWESWRMKSSNGSQLASVADIGGVGSAAKPA
jgi:uncharacterized membrane protein